MSVNIDTAAAIEPTTKREITAWASLSAEQRDAARVIALTADKLTAAVWRAAIEQAIIDVAPAEPTTKREIAAWAELSDEQRDAARAIALSGGGDKLSGVVWRAAIAEVTGAAETEKTPSKSQLAKDARAAKAAQAELDAATYGVFTIQDPASDDELFAVVLDGKHVVYTATNRRYVEVVSRALADGLAARVATALA